MQWSIKVNVHNYTLAIIAMNWSHIDNSVSFYLFCSLPMIMILMLINMNKIVVGHAGVNQDHCIKLYFHLNVTFSNLS